MTRDYDMDNDDVAELEEGDLLELPERDPVIVKTDVLYESLYKSMEELGKGKFGVVNKCRHKETGEVLAAKFVRKTASSKEEVTREIEMMNFLHHKRLIQLYDAYETQKEMIVIMELVTGGELFEKVVEVDNLTEKQVIRYVKQVLYGVEHMHRRNMVHLDLKPENILCLGGGKPGYEEIKLIDFGMTRILKDNEQETAMCGTPEFVAPEVITFKPITIQSDMWSIGVITYVLLSGLSPFMGDDDNETLKNVSEGDYDFEDDDEIFEHLSDEVKQFIEELLVIDPKKRLTVEGGLEHAWLTGNASEKLITTSRLKKFIARRRWQRTMNTIKAVSRLAGGLSLFGKKSGAHGLGKGGFLEKVKQQQAEEERKEKEQEEKLELENKQKEEAEEKELEEKLINEKAKEEENKLKEEAEKEEKARIEAEEIEKERILREAEKKQKAEEEKKQKDANEKERKETERKLRQKEMEEKKLKEAEEKERKETERELRQQEMAEKKAKEAEEKERKRKESEERQKHLKEEREKKRVEEQQERAEKKKRESEEKDKKRKESEERQIKLKEEREKKNADEQQKKEKTEEEAKERLAKENEQKEELEKTKIQTNQIDDPIAKKKLIDEERKRKRDEERKRRQEERKSHDKIEDNQPSQVVVLTLNQDTENNNNIDENQNTITLTSKNSKVINTELNHVNDDSTKNSPTLEVNTATNSPRLSPKVSPNVSRKPGPKTGSVGNRIAAFQKGEIYWNNKKK